MKQKILAYIIAGLVFLARKILLFDLILFALVCLSFLIWGPISANALSERLVWTGIGTALVAGILVFGQTTGGRQYGISGQFLGSAHGQNLIDFNIEARQAIEGRLGMMPRIFIIGAVLFGIGALIQRLFGQ